jgi:hypothetical protein
MAARLAVNARISRRMAIQRALEAVDRETLALTA